MEIPPDLLAEIAAKAADTLSKREKPPEVVSTPDFGGYHEAAAVLGRLSPIELSPTSIPISDDAIDVLLVHSILLDSTTTKPGWTLLPAVRIQVLRHLRVKHRISYALYVSPPHKKDLIARIFRGLLRKRLTRLDKLDLVRLTATYQVSNW